MLFLASAILGYIAGSVLGLAAWSQRIERARRAAWIVLVFTWVMHLGALIRQGMIDGAFPLTNGAEYLLMLGWVVLSLHLAVSLRLRLDVLGIVLPPLAGVTTLAGWLLLATLEQPAAHASSVILLFHTTVSTLGMAILFVAFAMSLVYLAQDRALKSKKTLLLLERFPALERSDQIGYHALVVGFFLLTAGIATGLVARREMYENVWTLGLKPVLPLMAWLVFVSILVLRAAAGFRGRKSAYLTIAGFTLGLLTVLGMTL